MLKEYFKLLTLPHDKLSHYFYGQVMTLIMFPFLPSIIILLAVLGISIHKEWWDSKNGGNVELLDILATLLGSAVLLGVHEWL